MTAKNTSLKKTLILILFLLIFFTQSRAENNFSKDEKQFVFVAFGPSFCFGDLGGSMQEKRFFGINDFSFQDTQYLISAGFRSTSNYWGYKLSLFHTFAEGADEGSRNAYREYELKTKTQGISAQSEFIFWKYYMKYLENSVYLFTGAGVVNSQTTNPKGFVRPKDTYRPSVTALYLPFGVGYYAQINKKLFLNMEFGFQYAFTDFLDGITTPYSKDNDVVTYLTFSVSYLLRDKGCKCLNVWN